MKPVKILSEYQKRYIEENFMTKTDKEIGEHLGLTETWVCLYRSKRKMGKTQKKVKAVNNDEDYFNVNKRGIWI